MYLLSPLSIKALNVTFEFILLTRVLYSNLYAVYLFFTAIKVAYLLVFLFLLM